jgi:hypothetical protein
LILLVFLEQPGMLNAAPPALWLFLGDGPGG